MFAVTTGGGIAIALTILLGLYVLFRVVRRFLGMEGEGRSGERPISQWVRLAQTLSTKPAKAWRTNSKGVLYAYDLPSNGEMNFNPSPGGIDDKIVIILSGDRKLVANFRQGELMFLRLEGVTLDDTTPEYRATRGALTGVLNNMRGIIGEDTFEVPNTAPGGISQQEKDQRRLALAEKKAKHGGGAVPKDIEKLAKRHEDR